MIVLRWSVLRRQPLGTVRRTPPSPSEYYRSPNAASRKRTFKDKMWETTASTLTHGSDHQTQLPRAGARTRRFSSTSEHQDWKARRCVLACSSAKHARARGIGGSFVSPPRTPRAGMVEIRLDSVHIRHTDRIARVIARPSVISRRPAAPRGDARFGAARYKPARTSVPHRMPHRASADFFSEQGRATRS